MRAIILAAGSGSRLMPLTEDRPKCLVSLAGQPLLAYQLVALRDAGITQIGLVTGYQAVALDSWGHTRWHNAAYDRTNMVQSLMCARGWLQGDEDVLIVYGDIVYESRLVRLCMQSQAPLATIVDRSWARLWQMRFDDPLSDAETLTLTANGHIADLGHRATSMASIDGQYIGMIRVGAAMAGALVDHYERLQAEGRCGDRSFASMYMTDYLRSLIAAGTPLAALTVDGGWLEVDTARDLRTYEQLHTTGSLEPICRLPETTFADTAS